MSIADNPQWQDLLQQGLAQLELDSSPEQRHLLLRYLDLLAKWGRAWNLTAILEPRQMIIQHLLDSLAIVPWVPAGRLLDVGTGAGLPGIPLAIMLPELEVTLVDSVSRKTRFLQQVRLELSLDNVQVETARVEALPAAELYDGISARAFASTEEFVAKIKHLCKKDGLILALKGQLPVKELEAVRQAGLFCQVHALAVPFLEAERHLIVIHGDKH